MNNLEKKVAKNNWFPRLKNFGRTTGFLMTFTALSLAYSAKAKANEIKKHFFNSISLNIDYANKYKNSNDLIDLDNHKDSDIDLTRETSLILTSMLISMKITILIVLIILKYILLQSKQATR